MADDLERYASRADPANAAIRVLAHAHPIWDQKPERVLAHILVWSLAWVLGQALAQCMGGLGDALPKPVEEFAGIGSGDAILPACRGDVLDRVFRPGRVTSANGASRCCSTAWGGRSRNGSAASTASCKRRHDFVVKR